METLFLKLFNMSIAAGWLVLAVLVLRLLLKKAPKVIAVVMWAFVGIRLLCPYSFESILSLIPSAETIPENIAQLEKPAIHSGISMLNSTLNPMISKSLVPSGGDSVNPLQVLVFFASVVWIVGMAVMCFYTVTSYIRVYRRIQESIPLRDNIWVCDRIGEPFLFGVVNPRIYLPSNISEKDQIYVIAHEKAHEKRHDHWWKLLGFLLLTVYWFQPVLWLAYILFCRDLELACDEKVIRKMGTESKKDYAAALINCSMPRKTVAACPLAFGEVGVKGRIQTVLHYKKPAFWVILLSIAVCIALAVGFLTNPAGGKENGGNKKSSLLAGESGSAAEGISISIKRAELDIDQPYLEIEWKNETNEDYVYGEYFDILYYDQGELISCAEKELIFNEIGNILSANDSMTKVYEIKDFDLSKLGNYRFTTGDYEQQWIDFEIAASPVMNAEADSEGNGVEKTYYCKYDFDPVMLRLSPADNSFSLSPSPASSYCAVGTYEEDENYIILNFDEKINKVTLKKEGNDLIYLAERSDKIKTYYYLSDQDKAPSYIPDHAVFKLGEYHKIYYDKIMTDIDQDGTVEECVLGYGPTSGINTFTFTVWEDDKLEYFNIFTSDEFYDLNFMKTKEGKIGIQGVLPDQKNVHEIQISIQDGNIILTMNGDTFHYWGEQGIDSVYAPD